MPYASKKQAAFFHANKDKLEKQGVNVSEWDKSTDFSTLPERKKKFSHARTRKKENQ